MGGKKKNEKDFEAAVRRAKFLSRCYFSVQRLPPPPPPLFFRVNEGGGKRSPALCSPLLTHSHTRARAVRYPPSLSLIQQRLPPGRQLPAAFLQPVGQLQEWRLLCCLQTGSFYLAAAAHLPRAVFFFFFFPSNLAQALKRGSGPSRRGSLATGQSAETALSTIPQGPHAPGNSLFEYLCQRYPLLPIEGASHPKAPDQKPATVA